MQRAIEQGRHFLPNSVPDGGEYRRNVSAENLRGIVPVRGRNIGLWDQEACRPSVQPHSRTSHDATGHQVQRAAEQRDEGASGQRLLAGGSLHGRRIKEENEFEEPVGCDREAADRREVAHQSPV